jgi:hypothetical protein
MRRNLYAGKCDGCRRLVRASEGFLNVWGDDEPTGRTYEVLCAQCAPAHYLGSPHQPPEASQLPSVHLEDDSHRAARWWER